jgi:hypothetical protein
LKKLLIACFLLGLSVNAFEIENLSEEEKQELFDLVNIEYGIDTEALPESELAEIRRSNENTRSFDIIGENGGF